MKKTLSIVLALCLAVSMIASFALIVPGPATSSDPITLVSIKVTDAAGYAAPYAAVDSAYAFVENQTAYVVFCLQVRSKDVDDGIALMDPTAVRTISVTSSTLDLTYAPTTLKAWYVDGATDAIGPVNHSATKKYDSATNTFKLSGTPGALQIYQPGAELDLAHKYYYAFIAVTKPATSGEVKASLAVSSTSFSGDVLRIYDSTGLKYIIHRTVITTPAIVGHPAIAEVGHWSNHDVTSHTPGAVENPASDLHGWYVWHVDTAAVPAVIGTPASTLTMFAIHDEDDDALIRFVNKAGDDAFDKIQAWAIPLGGSAKTWVDVHPDYFGKLTYVNAANATVDVTDLVNGINAFFGFSFANTDYPVKSSYFEDKTSGNPIVVTDTYNYVTAVVTEGDDNIEIAPTGDFSANIVIVMAASAVLAAAALAFVAKKAHE